MADGSALCRRYLFVHFGIAILGTKPEAFQERATAAWLACDGVELEVEVVLGRFARIDGATREFLIDVSMPQPRLGRTFAPRKSDGRLGFSL